MRNKVIMCKKHQKEKYYSDDTGKVMCGTCHAEQIEKDNEKLEKYSREHPSTYYADKYKAMSTAESGKF